MERLRAPCSPSAPPSPPFPQARFFIVDAHTVPTSGQSQEMEGEWFAISDWNMTMAPGRQPALNLALRADRKLVPSNEAMSDVPVPLDTRALGCEGAGRWYTFGGTVLPHLFRPVRLTMPSALPVAPELATDQRDDDARSICFTTPPLDAD